MEKIKTSRESETRKKESRKKDWTPPSSLDAPAAPQGYVHRWIRTATMGFEDVANVSKKHAGLIGIGGLVLARIPFEILKSRAEYFRKITQDRTDAIDRDLMKEQHPDMPINIERQSRVTFGGSRKK
jgi:hypothetical protein